MFRDRLDAGLFLAQKLRKFKGDPGVVLAVPRGGVPVGYAVARELNFPLDVILTKKIGHPRNEEYAIGAASLTDYFVIPHSNVSDEYVAQEVERIRIRLKDMYKKFMGDREPEDLKGKTVIVIDDGIATGNTLLATVNVLRKSEPAKIVIAVPVASKSAVQKLSKEVDEVIAIMIPHEFYGVGAFYHNFTQVSDEKVMFYLNKLRESGKVV